MQPRKPKKSAKVPYENLVLMECQIRFMRDVKVAGAGTDLLRPRLTVCGRERYFAVRVLNRTNHKSVERTDARGDLSRFDPLVKCPPANPRILANVCGVRQVLLAQIVVTILRARTMDQNR